MRGDPLSDDGLAVGAHGACVHYLTRRLDFSKGGTFGLLLKIGLGICLRKFWLNFSL